MLVESMEGIGHNPGIFEASIPKAVHVERAETETAQVVEQLIKSRESSGQWNFCDSCIGNTGVTLRAQKQQLQLNEAAQLKAADKKSEAHSAEGIRQGTGSTGEV
jgi:hypothetical protein